LVSGGGFALLPGTLSQHSFVDLDVSAPPLSLYPFLYAFGGLFFLVYFVLVRVGLFILAIPFRVVFASFRAFSWLGLILSRRRQQPSSNESSRKQTKKDNKTEDETNKERKEKMKEREREKEKKVETESVQDQHLSALGVLYLLLLAVSAGLTLMTHSFIGLLSATLVLGFTAAWQIASAKVPLLHSSIDLSARNSYAR
jgi:cation transport ATPase